MNMVVETAVNGVSDSDYTRRQTVHGVYIFRPIGAVGGGVLDAPARRLLAPGRPLPRHGGHPAVRRAVVHGRDGSRSGHRHGPHGPGFGGARLVVPPEREGRMGPVRLVHVKKKGKENDRP